MSSSIGSVTTKKQDPIPSPPPTPDKPTKPPPAIHLDAQPAAGGPASLKEFIDNQSKMPVSADCAKAVADGQSPADVAKSCTVREFAAMAGQPKTGAVPVKTDPACVKAYEKEGAAWGEAAGEEAKDLIKKAPLPIARHRVIKEVKEVLVETGKSVGHHEAAADCKVVTDPAEFLKYSPAELPKQCTKPLNYTPAKP